LDECQCDTDDEVIYCHNGRRTTLELPDIRLRGFIVIGLTNNAIEKLPDEKSILELFPDLMNEFKAIDVEGNAQFDCESLKAYKKIKVNYSKSLFQRAFILAQHYSRHSDCKGTELMITRDQRLLDIENSTDMLKMKYDDIDKEKIIKDVKDFFVNIAKKIEELHTK
uniref:ATPase n=1 Tax=Brugia timori TaxID=42155 RepID=A0A0R3QN65_9BILA